VIEKAHTQGNAVIHHKLSDTANKMNLNNFHMFSKYKLNIV